MAAPTDGTQHGEGDALSAKFNEINVSNRPKNASAPACGCKGIRSCLSCEKFKGIPPKLADLDDMRKHSYVLCPGCDSVYPGWDWRPAEEDPCDAHARLTLATDQRSSRPAGVLLRPDFISEEEEATLIEQINAIPWKASQSGRRKQDFGPKVNFKKRKVRCAEFSGFPSFVGFLLTRFSDVPRLRDFRPVELCHLNYDPARGATIDPHVDDSWLWGEHLVTVNTGAPTVLTLLREEGGATIVLRVPLPRRSLVVLYGEARYTWQHAIYREDVEGERIALTFRELSEEFRPGGTQESLGQELLKRAGEVIERNVS